METVQDILEVETKEAAAIAALTQGITSVIATTDQLRTDLAAALAGAGTIPPETQAAIDSAFAAANANFVAIQAAASLLPAPAAPTV